MMRRTVATLRTPAELVAHGLARAADLPELEQVAARYAVAVTPAIADPIGDHAHSPVAGIVHRYPDRVLLKLVHVCAVYCRFCFRREMVGPGKDTSLSKDAYTQAIDYIRSHPHIWEVIL